MQFNSREGPICKKCENELLIWSLGVGVCGYDDWGDMISMCVLVILFLYFNGVSQIALECGWGVIVWKC